MDGPVVINATNLVDKNGEVHVAGRNQVANEMVKDMVKKTLAKDKK